RSVHAGLVCRLSRADVASPSALTLSTYGWGFSGYARPDGSRSRLTGLPGPKNVVRCVLVTVQHQAAGGTNVGAHAQGFAHALPTATAILAGIGGRDCDHLPPGACCLGFKDAAE